MTTLAEARTSVYQRWIDNWTQTPFVFEGEADKALFSGTADWARLIYRNTGGGQKTLGKATNRKYERFASVLVSIFVPVDTGTTTAATLAQAARAIFEGVSFSGIFFNDGVVREIGEGDGRWFQTNVEVFSDYEETK